MLICVIILALSTRLNNHGNHSPRRSSHYSTATSSFSSRSCSNNICFLAHQPWQQQHHARASRHHHEATCTRTKLSGHHRFAQPPCLKHARNTSKNHHRANLHQSLHNSHCSCTFIHEPALVRVTSKHGTPLSNNNNMWTSHQIWPAPSENAATITKTPLQPPHICSIFSATNHHWQPPLYLQHHHSPLYSRSARKHQPLQQHRELRSTILPCTRTVVITASHHDAVTTMPLHLLTEQHQHLQLSLASNTTDLQLRATPLLKQRHKKTRRQAATMDAVSWTSFNHNTYRNPNSGERKCIATC